MNRKQRGIVVIGLAMVILSVLQCAEKEGPVNPYIESEPPQYVIEYVQVNPGRVNPGETAAVEAKVTDLDGAPVSNYKVVFDVDAGTILSPVLTNNQGIASTTFHAPTTSQRVELVASGDGAVPKKVFIQVGEGALSVSPQSILADGLATCDLEVELIDSDGNPIEGASVAWSSGHGTITDATYTTDESGIATARLVSEANTTDILATVQAQISYGDVSYAEIAYVEMRGVSVLLSAEPSEMPADGVSVASVTAQLLETTSNAPISDVDVYFGTTLGSIEGKATTNEAGMANVYLMSSTIPGVAQVSATYGGIQSFTYVTFGNLNLSLEASATRVVGDGVSGVNLTATLVTQDNTPIAGVPIAFSTTDGIIASSALTDNSGRATVTLTSPNHPGQATVTASFNQGVTASILIEFIDVEISLEVSNPRIAADGFSSQRVVAKLVSEDNNPVSGVTIDFTTSDGTITTKSLTDAMGEAEAILVSPTYPCEATVIASFANRKEDTAHVTFLGLNLDLEADLSRMVANASTQDIEAILTTEDGTPVGGATIAFSTTSGIVTASAVTDEYGKASAVLTSATTSGVATVTASYLDYDNTIEISFETPIVSLKAVPVVVAASPSNSILLTAYVTFADGEPVPDNTPVVFTTTEGNLSLSTASTESGIADVLLWGTGVANENVEVSASVAGSQATTLVAFTPDEPAEIKAYATPDTIPGDGSAPATIVAEVKDSYGNYVEDGTVVNFSVTSGNGIVSSTGFTSGGIATAQFLPTGGGNIATVEASTPGGPSDEVVLIMTSGKTGTIVADPDTAWIGVAATGVTSQVTVVAHVYDAKGSPVEDGTSVTFTIDHGPGGGEFIDDEANGYGPVTKSTLDGMTSVNVTSGTLPGTIVLKIEADSASAALTRIGIAAGPPDSIFITTGDIKRSGSGGAYVLCISGFVRDKYNNPVADGNVVYWTLDRSDIGIIDPEGYTGAGFPCVECGGVSTKGVAHACLVFPTSSMTKGYTIIARCGELESTFETSIPIVEPVEFTLEASPSSISGSAGGEISVWAYLEDDTNTLPITGATVQFSIDGAGSLATFYDVTDEYGLATTTLTIPPGTASGTTTVTGKVWMTSEQASVEITINP